VTGGAGALSGAVVEFDAPLDVGTVVFTLEVAQAEGGSTAGPATDEVVVRIFEDVTSAVFVDAEAAGGQADGSMGAPYMSIGVALEAAPDQDVYIRNSGRYDESGATLVLPADVSLYGGFDGAWRRDVARRSAVDLAHVGVSVVGSGERWLSGLDMTVGDAPAGAVSIGVAVADTATVHLVDSRLVGGVAGGGDEELTGNVSIGVRADGADLPVITRSTIHAGSAADGSPPFAPEPVGDAPDAGSDGSSPDGGAGAPGDDDGADPSEAPRRMGAHGGAGGVGEGSEGEPGASSTSAAGGVGGTSGEVDEGDLVGRPGAGGAGGIGGPGGAGGVASVDGVSGVMGTSGGEAQPGGGGAGGGGGAVAPVDGSQPEPFPGPTSTSVNTQENTPSSEPGDADVVAGGGGGGGAGGATGTPGAGGGGGGGSIGLWATDVDRLVIRESVVSGGRGGSGGLGAAGARGVAGSDGGNGAVPDADADGIGVGGGAGGGGAGGSGGGGGGGAGGPSIGLLTVGVDSVEVVATDVRGGAGGAGAAGGTAGADGRPGADGAASLGGLGGSADDNSASTAQSGVGASGGASFGWVDTGAAALDGERGSFEGGIGGPGGSGSSPGDPGLSVAIVN